MAERITAMILGQDLPSSNPLRRTLATYLGLAGIDAGYGYFAPNLPDSYQLVFELHYPNGHTEYRLPRVKSGAADLRLATLLEQIGRTGSNALREYMVKKLAETIWREHPEVKTIRAMLLQLVQPTVADYAQGKKEAYELLYAYDFSRGSESTQRSSQ
jgi:hypothetical protein